MIHILLCAPERYLVAIVKGTKHRCCVISWCIKKASTLHFTLDLVNNSGVNIYNALHPEASCKNVGIEHTDFSIHAGA
jgi:hypothetical protein